MSKRRINRTVDFDKQTVTFGVVGTDDALIIAIADLPEEMRVRAILHGLNGKVGDSAADPETDAMSAMQSTWDNVKAGNWNVRGGGGGPRVTVLAEALAQVTGQELDAVVDKLESMSIEERKEIPKKYAKVKAAMDAIKATRAQAKAKESGKAAKGAADDDGLAGLLGA